MVLNNAFYKIQLLLIIFFIVSCTTTDPLEFEGEPLIDLHEIHCSSNEIKYCEGRFKTQMNCTCVPDNIFNFRL